MCDGPKHVLLRCCMADDRLNDCRAEPSGWLPTYAAMPMYSTHAVSETCKFVFNSCQSH